MTTFRRNALAVFALASLTLLGACDTADRMQGLGDTTTSPAFSNSGSNSGSNRGSGNGRKEARRVLRWSSPTLGDIAVAEINASGGIIRVGAHSLYVPKHSVKEPTVFMMRVAAGNDVIIHLHAWRKRDWKVVDRFSPPLLLTMSYRDTDARGDKLDMVWLKDGTVNGEIEDVPSNVYKATKTIYATIDHFSTFMLLERD